MSKNKKTRLRNKINKTEQSNLKALKEIGGNIKNRIGEFTKKNAPKVKSNVKKTTKNISKSVKKNAPKLKKQGLKIGKGILKKGKGVGNVAKGIAKGTVKRVGGLGLKAATAKAMYESAKTGLKSWQMKGKDGKPAGLARIPGLIKKGWKNKGKLNIKKFNPASDENKRIRDKEKIIKSGDSTNRERAVARSQKSAIKRKRDGVTIADVHAKNKASMQNKAKKKNQDYKNLTREQFIKKYPNSNTAKKYGKRKGKRSLIKR